MSTFIDFIAKNGNELIFILCGLLGGVAHYLKKYLNKETDVPIWDLYGKANLAATIYTFLVFLFAMIGSIASGMINDQVSVWMAMYVGFVTGFALDAGFNSGANGKGTVTVDQMAQGKLPPRPSAS